MHPRHRLDIRFSDFASAAFACVAPPERQRVAADIERSWGTPGGFSCLSVRSGFDLLLSALAWMAGDEIVVSAVTHPDMIRIIEVHGLRAIPVDLDLADLAPRLEVLERALSTRTRAVMIAHLFGGRVDVSSVAERLAGTGILLIEDCAQALRGPSDTSDPRSDVAMFSFGLIKTATALGGAVLRIADPVVLARMRELEAGWPMQRRSAFARRLVRAALLRLASTPPAFGVLTRSFRALGLDVDAALSGAARGFPSDRRSFFARIRQRPSAPLLALLRRRLRRFDHRRLALRAALGERLGVAVTAPLEHPGRAALDRTHWLFPVIAPDRNAFIARLRANGFDSTQRTSAIVVVPAPPGRADLAPLEALRLLSGIVFLPAYPELPLADQERLAALLRRGDPRPGPHRVPA